MKQINKIYKINKSSFYYVNIIQYQINHKKTFIQNNFKSRMNLSKNT